MKKRTQKSEEYVFIKTPAGSFFMPKKEIEQRARGHKSAKVRSTSQRALVVLIGVLFVLFWLWLALQSAGVR